MPEKSRLIRDSAQRPDRAERQPGDATPTGQMRVGPSPQIIADPLGQLSRRAPDALAPAAELLGGFGRIALDIIATAQGRATPRRRQP